MSSKSIFRQYNAARTSRLVTSFDGVTGSVYSNLAVGSVSGAHRQALALVSATATDNDVWRVVNLKSIENSTSRFDSVAVLGAIDSDQATEWAMKQHGQFLLDSAVVSVAETNAPGLMRYLNSKDFNYVANAPIHVERLRSLQDVTTAEKTMWDGINLKSHGGQSSTLLLDLVKHDDHGQLFDAIRCDDMPAMLEALGAEFMAYDSLIVESRMLEKLTQRLSTAMSRATEKGVTVVNSRQSEPFKRNKVTQIMAIFEMSDGQSVSIVFHNPDSTPSKLLPQDTLISWKFLLNSRDISAAVQPNQGEDVQLPVLATRMMKLVNQNSARFARTNAKKAENVAALDEAKARIETKSQTVAALDVEIAQLQAELDKPTPVEPETKPQSKTPTTGKGLTDAQKVVLIATAGFKPAFRFQQAQRHTRGGISGTGGITEDQYNQAVQELNENGRYLKRSAITDAGRKIVAEMEGHSSTDKLEFFTPAFASADVVEPEPQLSTRAEVFKILTSDYGWSESRISGGIEKEFSGMAAAGEMSNGVRILSANFDSKERWIAVSDNAAPTGGAIIPSTEIDARIGGYTPDGFIVTAKAFNDAVEDYVLDERNKLLPEPTLTKTDMGNGESLVEGMAENRDGTFTALTLIESKTFKTRAGAERWLAVRGLNPDGTRMAKPEPTESIDTLASQKEQRVRAAALSAKIEAAPTREKALQIAVKGLIADPDLKDQAVHELTMYVMRGGKGEFYMLDFPRPPTKKQLSESEVSKEFLRLRKVTDKTPFRITGRGSSSGIINVSVYDSVMRKTYDFSLTKPYQQNDADYIPAFGEKNWIADALAQWFSGKPVTGLVSETTDPKWSRINMEGTLNEAINAAKGGDVTQPQPAAVADSGTVVATYVNSRGREAAKVLAFGGSPEKPEFYRVKSDYGNQATGDGYGVSTILSNLKKEDIASLKFASGTDFMAMDTTAPRLLTIDDKEVAYIKSVVEGGVDLSSERAIAEAQDEVTRLSVTYAKNLSPELAGFLSVARDITRNATPTPEEAPMPATNPDAEYLQAIVDGANQGTDKESRAKVREILTNAKAAANAEIEALATTAVNQIAARMKAAAQAKLAEVA